MDALFRRRERKQAAGNKTLNLGARVSFPMRVPDHDLENAITRVRLRFEMTIRFNIKHTLSLRFGK